MIYFLFLFLSFQSHAFVNPNDVDSSLVNLEASLQYETRGIKDLTVSKETDYPLKKLIFSDQENRIDDRFQITPYFEDRINFWFDIYTLYDSNTIIIHDLNNLKLTYSVLDYKGMATSTLHRFTKAKLQKVLTTEHSKRVKDALIRLSKGRLNKLNSFEADILKKVTSAYKKLPKGFKARKKFFLELVENVRGQTGQKDFIYAGILRFKPYQKFLYEKAEAFNLPKEIIAISFLESSFNPFAMSKVAASGVWQFMPFIGNLFMPKASKKVDYRESPIISTLAAFHLLKQNIKILKRWDLAVTAYNSGTKHLIKARKKYSKVKDLDLAYIIEHYETKHLGFASKNFYSEFIALVHVLAYKDSIYSIDGIDKESLKSIDVYVSKCFFGKKSRAYIFDQHKFNKEFNLHINDEKHVFKRGLILASAAPLKPKYYEKLTDDQLTSLFPKNYERYIKNKKCGDL